MAYADIRNCSILVSPECAGWVDQAAQDLAALTDGAVVTGVADVADGPAVVVGKKMVRAAAAKWPRLSQIGLGGLSDQGFVLDAQTEDGVVVCAGGGSRGDAYALIELVKSLDARDGRVLTGTNSRREEPFFIRRGIYAHQHWAYAYPYALRTWQFEDWRRYVDLLAYLKINLFSIWSMAGILPNPLTDGDREYLENYRAVIDYAKNRRGMEVYIGECANNVAESDGGVPVQKRRYFDVEVLKDPSDPRQFADIMDNRRNLYATADNADGYWIIDSDPGGFEDSPVSEFADILLGNRKLIDEHSAKGKDAKLAYWMWMGWAKGKPRDEREPTRRQAVEQMRDRLKEPWVLFTCWPDHLDAARDMGYTDKSVFFPYGTIEDEPSPPTTRLRFDEMYFHLNNAISLWGMRNAMGNAQSPLAQLPNIFFFAECAWHGLPPAEPAEKDVVTPLAHLLAPDAADDIAQGWLMLKETDASRVFACAAKLETIAAEERTGRDGALGRLYAPGVRRLVSDLSVQLKVHGCARELIAGLSGVAPHAEVTRLLTCYYAAALVWRDIHDYRRYMCYGPDVNEIAGLWKGYCEKTVPGPELTTCIREELIALGHEEEFVDGFLSLTPIDPDSQRERRSGG